MPSPERLSHGPQSTPWFGPALAVLAAFYLIFTGMYLQTGGLYDYMAVDFRSFRASAEIVRDLGFDSIYHLDVQERFQRPLYDAHTFGPPRVPYATTPTYYLPLFVLPFLPLLALPALPSFVLWTILNAAGLLLYLRRFVNAIGGRGEALLFLGVLLSFPMFSNLFLGQVNVWMLICMGEFILAGIQGRPFRSGLWLAGLLLKPQALLLLLPCLLIGRAFKVLAGFSLAGLAALLLSLLLVGPAGLADLGQLYLLSSAGEPTSHVEAMMNWRALALNLNAWLPGPLVWSLAGLGMALTIGLALWLWARPAATDHRTLALILLSSYAATCAATWHAHTHMALPLVVVLLWLDAEGGLPRALLWLWLLAPAAVFGLAALLLPAITYNLVGLSVFALNLYLLLWAARTLWQLRSQTNSPGVTTQCRMQDAGCKDVKRKDVKRKDVKRKDVRMQRCQKN